MQELFDLPITTELVAVSARALRVVIILIGALVVSRLLHRIVLGVAKRAVDALETTDVGYLRALATPWPWGTAAPRDYA